MSGEKKLMTRDEFEAVRSTCAGEMASDECLRNDALDVLVRADRYRWIHQTNWFGEPILNMPQDMFAIQEIIYKTRPRFIIEMGVAWGGSLLFYSTLMEVLGGEQVIGVDIFIPDDLKERLMAHGNLSKRLTLINGSSIEQDTLSQIKSILNGCHEVLIIFDSYHTHDHVLNELIMYSPLVGKGFYMICGDTVVENIPEQSHRSRPWGHGNNPMTALHQFLAENDRFEIDKEIENKLLFTCSPSGYLRCVKD